MTTEYALTKDGASVDRVRRFAQRPADPVGKGWRWLPVERVEGAEASTVVDPDGDVVTITTPAPKPEPRHLDPRDFMDRLPEAKQAAIAEAATSDAGLLRLLLRLGSGPVDLDSPETIAGLDVLVDAGLLTETDKTELLA